MGMCNVDVCERIEGVHVKLTLQCASCKIVARKHISF